MDSRNEKIIELIKSVGNRRYPTIILIEDDANSLSKTDISEIAERTLMEHVNFHEEILLTPDSNIILGAYRRGHFIEWLKEKSMESQGLLIENAETLFSTWPEEDLKAFYMEFLRTECNDTNDNTKRIPILLITRFASKFSLPAADRGQGIVCYLSSL